MILLVLLAQPLQNGDTNVALDDERLRDEVPKGLQKVELDLDDALFLEFEEKEEEPPPPPAEQEPEQTVPALAPQEQTAPKRSRKKILIFGLAAALCLLFGAVGAYFFMKSSSDEPTKQPAEAEEPQQQTEAAPHAQPEAASPEADNATKQPPVLVTHSLERFQVEFALADQIRILTFTLSIPNVTEIMRLEMQVKSVFIRDGIYGYLKSAPLSFLDNPANSDKLKSDLAAVINRHMKSGTVSEILIEEYVVR